MLKRRSYSYLFIGALFAIASVATIFLSSGSLAAVTAPASMIFDHLGAYPAWLTASLGDVSVLVGLDRSLTFASFAVAALMTLLLFVTLASSAPRPEVRGTVCGSVGIAG